MVWAVSLSTMKLIPHSLTPDLNLIGIRSLIRFGNLVRPLAYSVLYRHESSIEASPKAISGSTSYLPVRLAFHPYPQLIPCLFTASEFRPPVGLAPPPPWPPVDP